MIVKNNEAKVCLIICIKSYFDYSWQWAHIGSWYCNWVMVGCYSLTLSRMAWFWLWVGLGWFCPNQKWYIAVYYDLSIWITLFLFKTKMASVLTQEFYHLWVNWSHIEIKICVLCKAKRNLHILVHQENLLRNAINFI